MKLVRYNVAASLDGYITDSDGQFDWIPNDPAVDFAAIFARVDTVLLGRRSYEAMQAGGGSPWSPDMRVYIFSRTLSPNDHPAVQVVAEDAARVVAGLRAEPGNGEIWLFGGGELFATLLAGGQVDRVEVTVVPVLLGSGTALVASGIARTRLELTNIHRYPTGMVTLSYAIGTCHAS